MDIKDYVESNIPLMILTHDDTIFYGYLLKINDGDNPLVVDEFIPTELIIKIDEIKKVFSILEIKKIRPSNIQQANISKGFVPITFDEIVIHTLKNNTGKSILILKSNDGEVRKIALTKKELIDCRDYHYYKWESENEVDNIQFDTI